MHPYSIKNNDRFKVLWFIVPLAVIVAWLLNEFLLPVIPQFEEIRWLLRIPTSAIALGYIFYKWFEKDLWFRCGNWFGFVKTPNLSGTYHGILKSSRDNFQSKTEIKVNIKQTLRDILFTLSTDTSSSKSEMTAIITGGLDGPMLIHSFHNDQKKISEPDMQYHIGMSSLIFSEKDETLSGTYFTSPERGHHGEIYLEKIKKK
ncbi:Cap15 family cyclic dinucleotide receptor domain-containing protein [Rhodohalobacter sp. 8-1]|uniref:Cap15 family cyclic dinucleotide receptor domain-containing protein n=1 Tax=Rhodohalobacter sp. 8-1 TaxID=3131972 RepID=UPI0030EDEF84